jgi:hypothetical protein
MAFPSCHEFDWRRARFGNRRAAYSFFFAGFAAGALRK